MSSTLLEQYVRTQNAVTSFAQDVRERMREEARADHRRVAGHHGRPHRPRRRPGRARASGPSVAKALDRRVQHLIDKIRASGLAAGTEGSGPSREAATCSSSGSAAGSWPRISPPPSSPARASARGQTTVEWLARHGGLRRPRHHARRRRHLEQARARPSSTRSTPSSAQATTRSKPVHRRSRRSTRARSSRAWRRARTGRSAPFARQHDAPAPCTSPCSHHTTPARASPPSEARPPSTGWPIMVGLMVAGRRAGGGAAVGRAESSSARRRTWSPRRPAARSRTATTRPRSTPTSPTRRPAWSASARARRA